MKKDHKPETIVFFENIWHFLISVLQGVTPYQLA